MGLFHITGRKDFPLWIVANCFGMQITHREEAYPNPFCFCLHSLLAYLSVCDGRIPPTHPFGDNTQWCLSSLSPSAATHLTLTGTGMLCPYLRAILRVLHGVVLYAPPTVRPPRRRFDLKWQTFWATLLGSPQKLLHIYILFYSWELYDIHPSPIKRATYWH